MPYARNQTSAACPGDCNGDGATTIDELLTSVGIALGDVPVTRCAAADTEADGEITINEIVAAVQAALIGCPEVTPSPTPTATPRSEPTSSTGLRSVHLTVQTADGPPIDGFAAQIDERGERTSSVTVDVPSGSVLDHRIKDPAAVIVVFVSVDGYYTAVRVIDAPDDPAQAGVAVPLDVVLLPKETCLGISEACVGSPASGDFVPGEVIVGFSDWLFPSELEAALAPYCQSFTASTMAKTVSMWVDATQGDPNAAVAALEASPLVQSAQIGTFDGGPVTGTAIAVTFHLGVSVNDARDLVDSVTGLRWLRTMLSPTEATVSVPLGGEGEWVCELKRAPTVQYASLLERQEEH